MVGKEVVGGGAAVRGAIPSVLTCQSPAVIEFTSSATDSKSSPLLGEQREVVGKVGDRGKVIRNGMGRVESKLCGEEGGRHNHRVMSQCKRGHCGLWMMDQ